MDRKRTVDIAGFNNSNNNMTQKRETNPYTNRQYSQKYYDILEKRMKLPVYDFKKEFLEKVNQSQILLLVGETGSGKTTQVRMRNANRVSCG